MGQRAPRVHLVCNIGQIVAPTVSHNHIALGLELVQVVRYLGPEELRRVERGLVDHHGHALGLHALRDALDGARAEAVGVGLHRQAVHAHDRLRLALIRAVEVIPQARKVRVVQTERMWVSEQIVINTGVLAKGLARIAQSRSTMTTRACI